MTSGPVPQPYAPVPTATVDELSNRALLVRLHTLLIFQGDQLSAITDAVAATQAALDQLKVDIAAEIQQVVDALAAGAGTAEDVNAALAGLNTIRAQLLEQSTALQADNPPA